LAAGEALKGEPVKEVTVNDDGTMIVEPGTAEAVVEPASTVTPVEPAQSFPRVDPGSVVTPAAAPAAGQELTTLQSRFDVLEGKYNSEITRMSTALQASQNIINQQEALINSMQAGGGTSKEPASDFAKLNPDDYASYGSEMEQMASTVNKLIEENARLRSAATSNTGTQGANERIAKVEATIKNLSGSVQMSAKQAYYAALDTAIVDGNNKPEWERINHDPKFAVWLGQDEPLTGIPRKAILLKANQEHNAERVISVFTEYKRTLQGSAMPSSQISESGLARQAVPGTAGAEQDTDPNRQKQGLVTTETFNKAKNNFVQGRITEAEFDKVSDDYQRSIAQGMVR